MSSQFAHSHTHDIPPSLWYIFSEKEEWFLFWSDIWFDIVVGVAGELGGLDSRY